MEADASMEDGSPATRKGGLDEDGGGEEKKGHDDTEVSNKRQKTVTSVEETVVSTSGKATTLVDGCASGAAANEEVPPQASDGAGGGENPKSAKKKMAPKRKLDPQVLRIRRGVQQCCSRDDLTAAMELYREACASEIRLEAQTFYNLLSLCDGLAKSQRRPHIGTPRAASIVGAASQGGGTTNANAGDAHSDTEGKLAANADSSRGGTKTESKEEEEKKGEAPVADTDASMPTTTTRTTSKATSAEEPMVVEEEDKNEESRKSTEAKSGDEEKEKDMGESETATTKTEVSLEERRRLAFEIKASMDRLKMPLNETAYTALVRILSKAGDVDTAHQILQEAEGCAQCRPKLRLYSPLLEAYCLLKSDMVCALQLWPRMVRVSTLRQDDKNSQGKQQQQLGRTPAEQQAQQLHQQEVIVPKEREYCAYLQCAIQTRDVGVFERVLADLAEEVLVPARETTTAIVSWFTSPAALLEPTELVLPTTTVPTETTNMDCSGQTTTPTTTATHHHHHHHHLAYCNRPTALDQVQLPPSDAPSVGPVACQAAEGESFVVDHSVSVDTRTGELQSGLLQGERLRPVELSTKAWAEMLTMSNEIVTNGNVEGDKSQYQGGGKGRKRKLGPNARGGLVERRRNEWSRFKRFLHNRVGPPALAADVCLDEIMGPAQPPSGGRDSKKESRQCRPYDVIIDGANVGYFKQNFADAPKHIDYEQVDWVIHHFRNQGKTVLVVLHERHFGAHLLPSSAISIVRAWDEQGLVYRAPTGLNDDWFWIFAALWCGRGTMVLTNDEMRDHHFQMLARGSFLRWKERHLVRFSFGAWQGGPGGRRQGRRQRAVQLQYPEVYSRRIQKWSDDPTPRQHVVVKSALIIPLPRKGDTHRFLDGSHDADDDAPTLETYTIICCCRQGQSRQNHVKAKTDDDNKAANVVQPHLEKENVKA